MPKVHSFQPLESVSIKKIYLFSNTNANNYQSIAQSKYLFMEHTTLST